ncbi:MAG: hypothetical protein Kow0042_26500 [Calditrichia bacterium]
MRFRAKTLKIFSSMNSNRRLFKNVTDSIGNAVYFKYKGLSTQRSWYEFSYKFINSNSNVEP